MGFGIEAFKPLCDTHAVDVVMPDVMHCGGIGEFVHIARYAAAYGIAVSPHNACGPVATAASIQAAAVCENTESLELQWGEVEWRGDVVAPSETFEDGCAIVPTGLGWGSS